MRTDPGSGRRLSSAAEEIEPWDFWRRGYLLNRPRGTRLAPGWEAIPTALGAGRWAIGPFSGTGDRVMVETPAALWYASEGELVRIDRRGLTEWLRAAQ